MRGLDVWQFEDGLIYLDTEKNRKHWKLQTGEWLASEANGKPAERSGGWPEFWFDYIEDTRCNQRNAVRYIGYIHARRRELGLPPLNLPTSSAPEQIVSHYRTIDHDTGEYVPRISVQQCIAPLWEGRALPDE